MATHSSSSLSHLQNSGLPKKIFLLFPPKAAHLPWFRSEWVDSPRGPFCKRTSVYRESSPAYGKKFILAAASEFSVNAWLLPLTHSWHPRRRHKTITAVFSSRYLITKCWFEFQFWVWFRLGSFWLWFPNLNPETNFAPLREEKMSAERNSK